MIKYRASEIKLGEEIEIDSIPTRRIYISNPEKSSRSQIERLIRFLERRPNNVISEVLGSTGGPFSESGGVSRGYVIVENKNFETYHKRNGSATRSLDPHLSRYFWDVDQLVDILQARKESKQINKVDLLANYKDFRRHSTPA